MCELELLFVNPEVHSKGIGYSAWCLIEQLHPEIKIWETHTPYFGKRNIHFYVNRCVFHIVEYFNSHHPDANGPESAEEDSDGMFRFRKLTKKSRSEDRDFIVNHSSTDSLPNCTADTHP